MNMASCFNSKINKAIVAGLTHNRHRFDQLTELSTSVLFLRLLLKKLMYYWLHGIFLHCIALLNYAPEKVIYYFTFVLLCNMS